MANKRTATLRMESQSFSGNGSIQLKIDYEPDDREERERASQALAEALRSMGYEVRIFPAVGDGKGRNA